MKIGMFDSKQTTASFTILSYREAYIRLIEFIDREYWPLIPIPETGNSSRDLLPQYEAKSGAARYQGFWSGSGRTGELRLNEFLKDIYATQDSSASGCLVLLRWIEKIISSEKGNHLPGNLAKAVAVEYRNLFKAPASGDNCIVLTGSIAKLAQEEMASLSKMESII